MDWIAEMQHPPPFGALDPNFEVQDPSSLSAMTPKARINYELDYLRHDISIKLGNAQGLNDDNMFGHEQLIRMDQGLRERIAFIGAHPLFPEIRSDGRPDDCIQKFQGTLEKMSEGWVGTVREIDKGNCVTVQIAMGRAKVD